MMAYMGTVTVILLNILIAQMSTTYYYECRCRAGLFLDKTQDRR